jgi:uncharacterized repeat protein (TIGR03803 family)
MSKPHAGGRFVLSRIFLFIALALACAGRLAAQSASLQVLHSFSGPPNGFAPASPLVQGIDGNFYGVTQLGGSANQGTIFKVTPAGVLTILYSFAGGAGGANPEAALIVGSDGNFYGTTRGGGDSNGDGTVFQITPAGVLTTLHAFSGADGKNPEAGLIQGVDGNFYGTTAGDQGATGFGTVFKVTPAGVFTNLYTFTGLADGGTPIAGLIQGIDGNFYGTTTGFGINSSFGTAFKITPAGLLTTIHTFTGGANGQGPAGGLTVARDGNFYGVTRNGGDGNGDGTIFDITPAGVFTVLYTFSGGAGGANPGAGLTLGRDGNLYGTTYGGGDGNGDGTVFKFSVASVFTTLYSFSGTDGSHPAAALTQGVDGNFYSVTGGGGVRNANGTIYQITGSGTLITLYTFTGASGGAAPAANLTQGSDGNFYGTTNQGGIGSGYGTVFQMTPAGVFASLYAFSGGADGAVPAANLTQGSNGKFYGVTSRGGNINNFGTVYQITQAGALTTLHTFAGNANGGVPAAGLTLGNDGSFYGTTEGGGDNNGDGTVYKITTAGVLSTISLFANGTTGSVPLGALTLGGDGNFYGTTSKSGGNGDGTVFQVTPGGILTNLYTFGGPDGATPVAGLAQGNDGNFYGTTEKGGNGYGTVFRITQAGDLTSLYSFTGGSDGALPMDGLTLGSDGNFYGTTSGGGDSNGDGTIFQITPAGALNTIYTFSGADGANPQAGLTLGSDGNFYGTTASGGQNDLGVVFFLTLSPPVVTSQSATAQVGAAFRFQIVATNRATSYGASNLPAGLNVNTATGFISGSPTQSGDFTVAITASNAVGTGSGTLSLTVSPAPVVPPVVTSSGVSAKVGTPFSFQIAATNSATSFTVSNLPLGLSLDAGSGLISGTPTQSGTFVISVSAANSAGTGAGTLTLTVSPTPPDITSALTASGQAGQPFSYQIAGSNTPTGFNASGLPAGLSVDLGAGLISGTPSVSGTFSVNLFVANAGGTGTAVLTLTLAPGPVPAVTLASAVSQTVVGSGRPGKFILSLPAPATGDLVIKYKIQGTAINGVDYKLIRARQTINAGSSRKVIRIVPQGDLGGASRKTVTLTLKLESGYTIGTTGKVKVTILPAAQ